MSQNEQQPDWQTPVAIPANAAENPADAALFLYNMFLPQFKAKAKKLSSRARARVLNALIEYPLNPKAYVHNTHEEKELMAIGHSLLEAKFILTLTQLNANLDQLVEAADPEVEPDLSEEEKEHLRSIVKDG